MCGRLAQYRPIAELEREFNARLFGEPPPPRYNLAPGDWILAVRLGRQGGRELVRLHWGLIPQWAKERRLGGRTFNARAETLAEKPSFREPFKRRRCLIPADGFYEWQATPKGKQPYFIARRDGQPLALAGLWDQWTDPATGEAIASTTIIVTQANEALRPIHDRMPVILSPKDHDPWLEPRPLSPELARSLLGPAPAEPLSIYPVSRRVNRVQEDEPGLILPLDERPTRDE